MTIPGRAGRSPAGNGAPDVVVIGGGIVGCAAAAFLGQAGLRVLLVDGLGLAAAASGANSGVVQEPDDDALAPLYHQTLELYRELTALDAGFRLPPEPAGLLFVSRDLAVAERLAASIACRRPDQRPEVVQGASLQALEPALGPDLAACRVAMGHPVPPAASTYAYATLAERHGVTIRTGRQAEVLLDGRRATGIRIGGRPVAAGAVIVAAGPWTPELIDPSGTWRPIRRLWGVVVEVELDGAPRHAMEEAGIEAVLTGELGPEQHDPGPLVAREFSLVTAAGLSAVGSTFLPAEPDPAAWIEPLLARGATFVPGLAGAPIRGVRACARPRSQDGRPLAGPLPGVDGLYVCAGHGPWGISTGPATARLVTDLVLGRTGAIPAAFDPARFGSPWPAGPLRSPAAAMPPLRP